jgi:pyrroline-5-carboxylate reductase
MKLQLHNPDCTTEAALNQFQSTHLHEHLILGAKAALNRAEELGK